MAFFEPWASSAPSRRSVWTATSERSVWLRRLSRRSVGMWGESQSVAGGCCGEPTHHWT